MPCREFEPTFVFTRGVVGYLTFAYLAQVSLHVLKGPVIFLVLLVGRCPVGRGIEEIIFVYFLVVLIWDFGIADVQ